MSNKLDGPLIVNGDISSAGGRINITVGSVGDVSVSSDPTQRISADKVTHQFLICKEAVDPATAITAVTKFLGQFNAAGVIDNIDATIFVQATGSDRTVSVDIQKSTGGGAFATILTAPIAITHTTTILTALAASLASASVVAGDILQLVATVAGSAGAQAQGLGITITARQQPF